MVSVARDLMLTAVLCVAVSSCGLPQKRTLHVWSGVVLDDRTERPVEGALLVLHETRRPMVPFATQGWRAIAHMVTAADGRFRFEVCMTEEVPLLAWDDRGSSRAPEWTGAGSRNVEVRIFVQAPPRGRPSPYPLYQSSDEDTSETKACLR